VRLLLVDDSVVMRRCLRRCLADDGFEIVAEAADGVEALTMIGANPIDAVVMDGRMPRLDGPATMRVLAERCPELPVVAYTSDKVDGAQMLATGARALVLKGESISALTTALRVATESSTIQMSDVAVTT